GHLAGARAVWVSPDEALARLPLAALPGKEPRTYLLEEVTLAVVPVPLLLARADHRKAEPPDTFLVVAEPAYSAAGGGVSAPGRLAVRGREPVVFSQLPLGYNPTCIETSHGQPSSCVRFFSRDKATEETLRRHLPDSGHVHLSTHTFLAPVSRATAKAVHPGLLSGIALAGA